MTAERVAQPAVVDGMLPVVPATFRLLTAVASAHAALDRAIDRRAGICRVAGTEVVSVLLPLAEAPDCRLRLGELAERANLTPSGMTRRVDLLESAALVSRVRCARDRRGTYVELTPLGLAELRGALVHHGTVLDGTLRSLDGVAIRGLTSLLDELAGLVTPTGPSHDNTTQSPPGANSTAGSTGQHSENHDASSHRPRRHRSSEDPSAGSARRAPASRSEHHFRSPRSRG